MSRIWLLALIMPDEFNIIKRQVGPLVNMISLAIPLDYMNYPSPPTSLGICETLGECGDPI